MFFVLTVGRLRNGQFFFSLVVVADLLYHKQFSVSCQFLVQSDQLKIVKFMSNDIQNYIKQTLSCFSLRYLCVETYQIILIVFMLSMINSVLMYDISCNTVTMELHNKSIQQVIRRGTRQLLFLDAGNNLRPPASAKNPQLFLIFNSK